MKKYLHSPGTSSIRYFFILVLLFANSTPNQGSDTGVCEGCSNPLVQIMPLQIGGDIPDSSDGSYWDDIKEGARDFSDDWIRGFEFATNFIKKNPCAEFFYVMENPNPYGDPLIRIGVPFGEAEYEVRSWAVIEKASRDEKTLVRHVVYKTTPLAEPKAAAKGYLETNKVEEVTNQLELVPLLGRIQVSHDLVCLKNGQTYDSGSEFIDWVSAPPTSEHAYFPASGESTTVNGNKYTGNLDGVMIGDFSSMVLSGSAIVFDKGEIGTTIRKKETPSSATIAIDDSSGYPPYYLITISEIKNEFGEPMPDAIPIALRVDQGEIESGRELDGHKVFVTKNGGIPDPIRYRPPRCAASAKSANLELRSVCHWSGSEMVRETRARKSIELPVCGTFKGTITYKRQIHWEGESVSAGGTLNTTHDLSEDLTLSVTAKFLRTVKDSSGSVDYYEAKPLTGRYSFSLEQVNRYTSNSGGYTQVDSWQDSGVLNDKLSLLLVIDPKKKEYRIHSQIITPSKKGTSELTYSNGKKIKLNAGDWAINGSLDVDGKTDGTSVSGNWSKPATKNTAVTNTGGMVSGATWNWSLQRAGE